MTENGIARRKSAWRRGTGSSLCSWSPGIRGVRTPERRKHCHSKAIALVPHIPVIDDREGFQDPKYYVNYDHPSPAYFDHLVSQLGVRGFLPRRDRPANQ